MCLHELPVLFQTPESVRIKPLKSIILEWDVILHILLELSAIHKGS